MLGIWTVGDFPTTMRRSHTLILSLTFGFTAVAVLALFALRLFKKRPSLAAMVFGFLWVAVAVVGVVSWAVTYFPMRRELQDCASRLLVSAVTSVSTALIAELALAPQILEAHAGLEAAGLGPGQQALPVPLLFMRGVSHVDHGLLPSVAIEYRYSVLGGSYVYGLNHSGVFFSLPAGVPVPAYFAGGAVSPNATTYYFATSVGRYPAAGTRPTSAVPSNTESQAWVRRRHTSPTYTGIRRVERVSTKEKHRIGATAVSAVKLEGTAASWGVMAVDVHLALEMDHTLPTDNARLYVADALDEVLLAYSGANARYLAASLWDSTFPEVREAFGSLAGAAGNLTIALQSNMLVYGHHAVLMSCPVVRQGLSLLVVVEIPYTDIFAAVDSASEVALALVVAIAACCSVVLALVASGLVRHARLLAENMRHVEWMRTERVREMPPAFLSEFVSMQNSFRAMHANLCLYKAYLPLDVLRLGEEGTTLSQSTESYSQRTTRRSEHHCAPGEGQDEPLAAIVFTDIKSSTELWQCCDAMPSVLPPQPNHPRLHLHPRRVRGEDGGRLVHGRLPQRG